MPFVQEHDITAPQGELFLYIIETVCERGFQPSTAEMAEKFNVTRKAIVDRLHQLAKKGVIEMPGKKSARCIVLKNVKFKVEMS